MDTNIYYIPQYKAVSVIANFAETRKQMDLGMSPKVDYIPMTISDFSRYEIEGIGLMQVENDCFQTIREIFSNFRFKSIAFHESNIDLEDVVIDAQHLIIGNRSKVNVSEKNFQNLEEITFLELKTYKGKVLTVLNSVKKIVMWYEGKKDNAILSKFAELKELHCFNGIEIQLDIRKNKWIESLQLANFPKLEHVLLDQDHVIKELKIENCKKLDISNLPVTSIWPPRKENIKTKDTMNSKSTENQHFDHLIIDLKKNMEEYMNEADPSYTQDDIEECISIITNYTIEVFKTKSKSEGMEIVKSTILKLNDLNEKCDYSLIETNEREQIAEIIIGAGSEMGYNTSDEDITEEWREW